MKLSNFYRLFSALFFLLIFPLAASADLTIDDNQGFFLVDMSGNQLGLAPAPLRNNIAIDINAGTFTMTASPSFGSTVEVRPISFDAWKKVKITALYNKASDLNVDILDCSTNLPVTGFAGLGLTAGEIDISSIDVVNYPCLRVKVNLSDDDGILPVVDDIRVIWHPLPQFLVSIEAPVSQIVGKKITYNLNYSVSYVEAEGTVLWMPRPVASDFTASYGQDTSLSFVSASQGGQYTTAALTLHGITVPANSVYWDLGTQSAGEAGNVSAQFKISNGQENDTVYMAQGSIDCLDAELTVSDSDIGTTGNQPVETVVVSAPNMRIIRGISGAVSLNGNSIPYNGGSYNGNVNYSISVSNYNPTSESIETVFNPIIVEDVSEIIDAMLAPAPTGCNVANPASLFTLNNGGVLDLGSKTITWDLADDHIAPGGSRTLSYSVDYNPCLTAAIADGTRLHSNADYTDRRVITDNSDNTGPLSAPASVLFGLDTNPYMNGAKGERTNGSGIIRDGIDDHPNFVQPLGTTYSYLLSLSNPGAVRIDDNLIIDKIPAGTSFLAVSVPAVFNAQIFYSTSTSFPDPTINPDYNILAVPGDLDAGGNNYWEDYSLNPPLDNRDITWIAVYIPTLSSNVFPCPAGSECENIPSGVVAEMQVGLIPEGEPGFLGVDSCTPYDVNNAGLFYTHSAANNINNADGDVFALSGFLSDQDLTEPTHVGPALASFSSSALTGDSDVNAESTASYTFNIVNSGTDTALNTSLKINLPEVFINGQATFLSPTTISGGTINYNNLPNYVTVSLGNILAKEKKTVHIALDIPAGIFDGSDFNLVAQASASDDDNCASISHVISKNIIVHALKKSSIRKTRDEALIDTLGEVNYTITFRNTGQSPVSNTYIVDKIPAKAHFAEAYTSPAINSNGNSFNCNDCQVFFAKDQAGLPAGISPASPFTASIINTYFTPGVQTSSGVWVPPASYCTPEEVVYVAWKIDDPYTTPPLLATDTIGSVGLLVLNDDDSYQPSSIGSDIGTLVENISAVFGDGLLQAISNLVFSTVLPDPGLNLNKTSSTDIVTANENFEWYIDYYNDSGVSDTEVVIVDTLPFGANLLGISNAWNATAQFNDGSLNTNEYDIGASPNVTLTPLPGGATEIRIVIADKDDTPTNGLRGSDLAKNEGGRITIHARADSLLSSGSELINTVEGCYENSFNAFCITEEDSVYVENADLYLRKFADLTNPVPGDVITYSLIISNKGAHAASNIEITDTLPAGLCYLGSGILTPNWSLGNPSVSTSDCTTAPTTLNWTDISYQSGNWQEIPGNSGDIIIAYAVQVAANVLPDTSLNNIAAISSDTPEDPEYENSNQQLVRTPLPDAYVNKNVPLSALPGESVQFEISYGNTQRIAASNVYLIDTLPDYNTDGVADLLFNGVSGANGEQFFCHNQNILSGKPAFDPTNPLSNGWVAEVNCNNPNFIAVLVGNLPALAGPKTVTVNLALVSGGKNVGAGLSFTNSVEVFSSEDDDNTNNTDTATVSTPGADLEIQKTGSTEGGYPGISPGENLTYTITARNSGTQDVCAVRIDDTIPGNLSINGSLDNFTTLNLTNAQNEDILPHDSLGNAIPAPVSIARQSLGSNQYRWLIGGVNYSDVCLPPGASFSFTLNLTINTDVADNTLIENCANIVEDSPALEEILANNTDCSNVTVYRADLMISKLGYSCGPNDSCQYGDSDNSFSNAGAGEQIQYFISYDNIGNYAADNAVITENIPLGSCFQLGSLTPPGGSIVEYSTNNGLTYSSSYVPTANYNGDSDCNITNFRVKFNDPLAAPATFWSQSTYQDFLGSRYEFGNYIEGNNHAGTEAIPGSSNTGQVVLGSNGDITNKTETDSSTDYNTLAVLTNDNTYHTVFGEYDNSSGSQINKLFYHDESFNPGDAVKIEEFSMSYNDCGSTYNYPIQYSCYSNNQNTYYFPIYYKNYDIQNNLPLIVDNTGVSHLLYQTYNYINNADYEYDYSTGMYNFVNVDNSSNTTNLKYWDSNTQTVQTISINPYTWTNDNVALYSSTTGQDLYSFALGAANGTAHLVSNMYDYDVGESGIVYWNSALGTLNKLSSAGVPDNLTPNDSAQLHVGTDGIAQTIFVAQEVSSGMSRLFYWDTTLGFNDATAISAVSDIVQQALAEYDEDNNIWHVFFAVYDSVIGNYVNKYWNSGMAAGTAIDLFSSTNYLNQSISRIDSLGQAHIVFRVYSGTSEQDDLHYWNSSMAAGSAILVSNLADSEGYVGDAFLKVSASGKAYIIFTEQDNNNYTSMYYWDIGMAAGSALILSPNFPDYHYANFIERQFSSYSDRSFDSIIIDNSDIASVLFTINHYDANLGYNINTPYYWSPDNNDSGRSISLSGNHDVPDQSCYGCAQQILNSSGDIEVYFVDQYEYAPGNYSSELYKWTSTDGVTSDAFGIYLDGTGITETPGIPNYFYNNFYAGIDQNSESFVVYTKETLTSEGSDVFFLQNGTESTLSSHGLSEGYANYPYVYQNDNGEFRVQWSEHVGNNPVTGDYESDNWFVYPAKLATSGFVESTAIQNYVGNIVSWGKLFVNYEIPASATPGSLTFDIYDANSDTVIPGYENLTITSGNFDLSGIDATAYPRLKLRANFTAGFTADENFSPVLEAWTVTYFSDQAPGFPFRVRVEQAGLPDSIKNKVTIATDSPESNSDNNTGLNSLLVTKANLRLSKDVNFTSARQGDNLVYTIEVCNDGPAVAEEVIIEDLYPTNVSANSIDVGCFPNGNILECSIGTLAAGECVSKLIEVQILSFPTVTDGDFVNNRACVSGRTYDPDTQNNCELASTVVADVANVYLAKDGPVNVNINSDITYVLTYGNSGNIAADDVVITDDLAPEVTLVQATDNNGYFTCAMNAGDLVCDNSGVGATLPSGTVGTIEVTVHVNNDLNLLTTGNPLINYAEIVTSTVQSSISDDSDIHSSNFTLRGLSGISGKVFNDLNTDTVFSVGSDLAIENVKIFLGGNDIFGKVYGPNPLLYPTEYNNLMSALLSDLITNGTVPGGTTVSTLSSLANYEIIDPVISDENGEYNISGLLPGSYSLLEETLPNYLDAGSDAGQIGAVANDTNILSTGHGLGSKEGSGQVNLIQKIALAELSSSIKNNFYKTNGSIGNLVFSDLNANGIFDGTDTGLLNVELSLYADLNNNGLIDAGETVIATKITDVNGNYKFSNLPLGAKYVVKVSDVLGILDGQIHTLGTADTNNHSQVDNYVVSLSTGNTDIITADFGYYEDATLGNYVWYDTDNDGIQDSSETGIAGIEIKLYQASDDTLIDSTFSAGNGSYGFQHVPIGDYYLEAVLPAGYAITTKDQGVSDDLDSDFNIADRKTDIFTLNPNDENFSLDLGAVIPGSFPSSISGTIWLDETNDEVFGVGETGIPGVTVELLDASGNVISAINTDAEGNYSFSGLITGNYKVQLQPKPGFELVTQDVGSDDTIDSDFNPTTGITDSFTLAAGQNLNTIDAGATLLAGLTVVNIGDRVWFDSNINGVQDSGEAGIPGVVVELLDGSSNFLSTATTDADGIYHFNNLITRQEYRLKVIPPAGYSFTLKNVGNDGFSFLNDSDVHQLTGITDVLLVPAVDDLGGIPPEFISQVYNSLDAGLHLFGATPGAVQGVAWIDANSDGIRIAEAFLSNVTVKLYNESNQLIATDITDSSGAYLFTNLVPGNYSVEFVPVNALYQFSPQGQGSDSSIDSDVIAETGRTVIFAVNAGEVVEKDSGFITAGKIGNLVFNDLNSDGIFDPLTESGITGVEVGLYNDLNGNGILDSTDTLRTSAFTSSTGGYLFSGLPLDSGSGSAMYLIKVIDSSNTLAGYTPTSGAIGIDNNSQNHTGYEAVLSIANYENYTADFGYFPPEPVVITDGMIGDKVWFDSNEDGIQQASEPGVAGISVKLYNADTNSLITSTQTDGLGRYAFDNLAAGNYQLKIEFNSVYSLTLKDQDDDSFDSDFDIGTLKTDIIVLSETTKNHTIDAGLKVCGSLPAGLGSYVWFDTNQNGLQDGDESGLAGVTVELLDSFGAVLSSIITDNSGYYFFGGLLGSDSISSCLKTIAAANQGEYYLRFTAPAGYILTSTNIGTDDTKDSDVDTASFTTEIVTLKAGENTLHIDAGYFSSAPAAKVTGFIWYDSDQDGTQDASESGIAGVTVELYTQSGTLIASYQTTPAGMYTIENILEGDYKIKIIANSAYSNSPQDIGSDANDSDLLNNTELSFSVTAGEIKDYDAGLYLNTQQPVSLGSYVWNDSNQNGLQESTENPVAGIQINLFDEQGVLISYTTTDEDGLYLFNNLVPGIYIVEIILPEGYQLTALYQGSLTQDSDFNDLTQRSIRINLTSGQSELYIDAGIFRAGSASCEGDSNMPYQIQIDSNSAIMQDLAKRTIRIRNKHCSRLKKAKSKKILEEVSNLYVKIWEQTWRDLPMTQGQANSGCNCQTTDYTDTINAIESNNQELYDTVISILPKACDKQSNSKKKVRKHKKRLKKQYQVIYDAIYTYPNPQLVCE